MFGIIFDCDGTLVDSEYAHLQSWREAVRKRGGDITLDDYYGLAGFSSAHIAEHLHDQVKFDSADAIVADKRDHFHALQKQGIPAIERTVAFVRQLIKKKEELMFKLAVASAATKKEILLNLDNLGLSDAFDVVVSGKDDISHYEDPEGTNKPKPYIYLHTAHLLGLEPARCVAFEDSGPGVQSATSAGVLTIAVPNAFTAQHDFTGAAIVIDPSAEFGMDAFLELIQKHGFI